MAKRTKKVGPSGRFQARYGVRSRSRLRNIEILQHRYHPCPRCGEKKVKRLGTGIWHCRKCGVKFAGGSYLPRTESGQSVEKTIRANKYASKIAEQGEEGI